MAHNQMPYNASTHNDQDACYIDRNDRSNARRVRRDLTNFSQPQANAVLPADIGMTAVNGYGPNPYNVGVSTTLREGAGVTNYREKQSHRGRIAGAYQGRGRPPVAVESELSLGAEPTHVKKACNSSLHFDNSCRNSQYAPTLGRWNPQQVKFVVAPTYDNGGWEHDGRDTRMDGREIVGKTRNCLSWTAGTGGMHKQNAVAYLRATQRSVAPAA